MADQPNFTEAVRLFDAAVSEVIKVLPDEVLVAHNDHDQWVFSYPSNTISCTCGEVFHDGRRRS